MLRSKEGCETFRITVLAKKRVYHPHDQPSLCFIDSDDVKVGRGDIDISVEEFTEVWP